MILASCSPKESMPSGIPSSGMHAIYQLQKECVPATVSMDDVDVSHLILGPDLMDLRLHEVQILHLNDFRILKLKEVLQEDRNGKLIINTVPNAFSSDVRITNKQHETTMISF